MIFVDSSVWIDFFRDQPTRQVAVLEQALDRELLATGDLVLAEVLQGCTHDAAFKSALDLLTSRTLMIDVGGRVVAEQAARNYRKLREYGVTVRRTIDMLIATRCLQDGYRLLHADRDFEGFERHLGLRVVPLPAAS